MAQSDDPILTAASQRPRGPRSAVIAVQEVPLSAACPGVAHIVIKQGFSCLLGIAVAQLGAPSVSLSMTSCLCSLHRSPSLMSSAQRPATNAKLGWFLRAVSHVATLGPK